MQKAQYKPESPAFMVAIGRLRTIRAMNLTLASRFSRRFGLSTPIALAPMALASGGALGRRLRARRGAGTGGRRACRAAWTQHEYALAAGTRRRDRPHRLRLHRLEARRGRLRARLGTGSSVLAPSCFPLVTRGPMRNGIAQSGAELLFQVQRMEQVPMALEAGASVIIAQGAEAGGHGANSLNSRATISFVPELADWLDRSFARNPVARRRRHCGRAHPGGGAGAGRGRRGDGLTAVGDSRKPGRARGETAGGRSGRATARHAAASSTSCAASNWPAALRLPRASAMRSIVNGKTASAELRSRPDAARADYEAGSRAGDFSRAHATVGESVGLIRDLPGAAELVARISSEARQILER